MSREVQVFCHFARRTSKCSKIVVIDPARLWTRGSCGDCTTTEGSTMRAKHVPSISRRAPSAGPIRTIPRDKEASFKELLDFGLKIGRFLGPMAAVAHRGLHF